jgi:hypothetical protein
MKAVALCLVVGLIVLGSGFARAETVESTRCDDHVIEIGDSAIKVLQYCGEPTRRFSGGGFVTLYYDIPGQDLKIFHIEDEKVDSMEEVDR